MTSLQNAVSTGDNDSIKSQLDKMREFCSQRLKFIMEQQARGFASPQFENVFLQYIKMMQIFMDKAVQYRKEVELEKDDMTENILSTYERRLLNAIQQSVKEVYGEDRIEEFNSAVASRIESAIEKTLEEHGFNDEA